MGRKGNWFSSVKKAFSPESKRSKEKKSRKGKSTVEEDSTPLEIPSLEEIKLAEVDDEPTEPAFPVVQVEAEAAVASHGTTEVVRAMAAEVQFPGRSMEEVAAIRIQTALRGYLARRSLRAIRGLVRLKTLAEGPNVKRQTGHALKCMQTLARVQARIQSTRINMLEENQALHRQLLQKRAKDESLQLGEEWDVSLQSKEQIEANLLSKYEAAMRRERALAYAYSHQQNGKKSARPAMLMFMDPSNPHWGWSWLERWTEAHPLEEKTSVGEISKALEKPSPAAKQQPSSLSINRSKATLGRKLKPASPRVAPEDDSKSSFIARRHSVSGSSVTKDDETSISRPSYMVSTKSAKAKSRTQSHLGLENGAMASAKKRLSFQGSPAGPRRLSGPSRMETTTTTISNAEGCENSVIAAV